MHQRAGSNPEVVNGRVARATPDPLRPDLREWFCLNCQTLRYHRLEDGSMVCTVCGMPWGANPVVINR